MDKIMHWVQSGNVFILDDDEGLYVSAPGKSIATVYERIDNPPNRRHGYLSPTDPKWSVLTTAQGCEGFLQLPTHEPLKIHTDGSAVGFVIQEDPEYKHEFFATPEPTYTVTSQTIIKGKEPWVSPVFDLMNVHRGKLIVQLSSVWRCARPHGFGTFHLETSDDKQVWDIFESYGLTDGMMITTQNGAQSGDLYEDEFYITNPGRWGRVVYDSRSVLGEGYQAAVTVELAKSSSLRS